MSSKEDLQKDLDSVIARVKASNLEVSDLFKVTEPKVRYTEPQWVMEQYFCKEGRCEERGKYVECCSLTVIPQEAYTKLKDVLQGIGVRDKDFVLNLWLNEHTDISDTIVFKDNGIISAGIRGMDSAVAKLFSMLRVHYSFGSSEFSDSIEWDFGTNYGVFGGYIKFKKMPPHKINCFKEMNINTLF